MIALVPFFLASGVFFIVFRQYAVAGKFIPASGSLLSEGIPKAAMAAKIMFFYFFRVFTNLGSFDFDHSQLLTPLSGTVVAWALLGAILQKRKRPQLLFGLLFYLLCLIPVLNLYKTQPLVSPRYSFLPCLGLYFAVMAMPFRGKGKYLSLFCAAATFLWTLMTMHKTDYWKNNVTFWELMASRDKTEFSYQQLGYAYSEAGQYAKARDALKMVWPQPPSPNFFAALGRACFESGDYQCAIQAYENVLTLDPGNDSALPYLASSYKAAGDRQSVQRVFSKLRK
jgi:tetratricopeptide (TPR) repeat protein